jgi:hypothetical protein
MILDLENDAYSFHSVNYSIAALEKEIDQYDSGRRGLKEVLRRTTVSKRICGGSAAEPTFSETK